MCFEAAASDMAKGSASWPTVRSPEASSRSMRRRVRIAQRVKDVAQPAGL